jgi:hypothetical protein
VVAVSDFFPQSSFPRQPHITSEQTDKRPALNIAVLLFDKIIHDDRSHTRLP